MTTTDPETKRSFLGRYWIACAIGVGVAIIPALLWLFRIPIAEMTARQVCKDRGVVCRLQIDQLSTSKVSVSKIDVRASTGAPVLIDRVALDLGWSGPFAPEIRFVEVDRPRVTIDTTGGAVRIPVLDQLQSGSSGGGGFEMPSFAVMDGQVTVLTDAGPVNGTVSSSGSIQREIRSSMQLDPTELVLDDYRLSLQAARADLLIADGRVSGQAEMRLSEAGFETSAARDIRLNADLQHGGDNQYTTDWIISAGEAQVDTASVSDLTSEGTIHFTLENGEISADAVRIDSIMATALAGLVRFGDMEVSTLGLTAELEADESALTGPIGISGAAYAQNIVAVERFVLTGEVALDGFGTDIRGGTFEGAFVTENVRTDSAMRDRMLSAISLPDPLNSHASLLRASLNQLFSTFSAGVEFRAGFDGETADLELTSARPVAIQGPRGQISLGIEPPSDGNWLTLTGMGYDVSGRLTYIDARRGIRLSAAQSIIDGGFIGAPSEIALKNLNLSEVSAGGRRLAATAGEVSYHASSEQNQIFVDGDVRFTGLAFGMELFGTRLRARLQGLDSGSGWNFRFEPGECLRLAFLSATLAETTLGPGNTELCAPGDRLFTRNGDAISGVLTTSSLSLPMEAGFGAGTLTLGAPRFSWALEDSFSLEVAASDLALPLVVPGDVPRNVDVASEALLAKLTTENGVGFTFAMTDTDLAVQDVPVDITIAEVKGEGTAGEGGPLIDYSVLGALMSDSLNPEDNALYAPMVVSGDGQMTASGFDFDGTLRLASRFAFLGNLSVTHMFDGAVGEAVLNGGRLQFQRQGLQFHHVSERLRGIAVNAEGAVQPVVFASWDNGQLAASGGIEIEGLGFATFRLGEIRGLSGELEFTDLLDLKTAPHQHLTLEELRFTPTISLMSGAIDVSVLGPDEFALESAIWPFVGGELSVEPLTWRMDSPSQLVTVTAENWELSRLLGLFQVPELDVHGRVSGAFPIEIVGVNAYFRNARLTAVEDGVIQYDSDIARSAGQADPYAKMAFDALKNFEYEVLSVGADGNLVGNIILDLALSGHNPDVMDGQVFNLNIRLDSDIAKLVHAGSISASVSSAQDLIVDLVNQSRQDEQSD